MKNRVILLAIFLLLLGTNIHSVPVQTVALIPFSDDAITHAEAVALSDILENRLVQIGNFNLIEKRRVTDLMQELALATSDFIDPATAVQAGKLLSARWLILGSVSKLGKFYEVNVKLVETETGRIVAGADGNGRNSEELKDVMERLARKLSSHLLSELRWSVDFTASVLLQATDLHSLGLNISSLYAITPNFSLGGSLGVVMRIPDSEIQFVYGGKLQIGDPRKYAINLVVGTFPAVGVVVRNIVLEFSPLMLLGVKETYGISLGYSLSF